MATEISRMLNSACYNSLLAQNCRNYKLRACLHFKKTFRNSLHLPHDNNPAFLAFLSSYPACIFKLSSNWTTIVIYWDIRQPVLLQDSLIRRSLEPPNHKHKKEQLTLSQGPIHPSVTAQVGNVFELVCMCTYTHTHTFTH